MNGIKHVTCPRDNCEWVLDLHERHTPQTWDALSSRQRVAELVAHSRHHTPNK